MIIEEQTIDADFRNDAATALLNECDIVITNPPFSLFRVFFDWLMAANKQFLIMGTLSACTYKNVFPYIKDDLCWLGVTNRSMSFRLPDTAEKYNEMIDGVKYSKLSNAAWYTNLPRPPFPPMELKTQAELEASGVVYQKYDNYDAIEVPELRLIPADYDGVMGVPVSFLTQYNPDQFEIVAFRKGEDGKDLVFTRERERKSSTVLSYPCTTSIPGMIKNAEGMINGKPTYARILIQRKSPYTY